MGWTKAESVSSGGGFDLDENGSSVQVRDHKRSDANVACFEKNKKEHIPLVVILGNSCHQI